MTVASMTTMEDVLKAHFGYESFRPFQKDIIEAAIGGTDVFAVLPTGGGKSLCFQLPPLLNQGLTLVISPLIALMKDQVDSLLANGIPAVFINSTLSPREIDERFGELDRGKHRLLYLAPERLMMEEFMARAKKWTVNLIAIDEAHCISEWGHDFRPEYRQLSRLREFFPNSVMMALTATATKRVQADIVEQLKLKAPRIFVASFNRPNLTYRVMPRHNPYEQLLSFLRNHKGESGIVYALSRKTCDMLADRLKEDGVSALPYHAGMESSDRNRNQERFLRDDAQVICATIAFGMGVHKSNVRFVTHYNLPRNVESYYQETGRAGRDGLPSECLLLYSPQDAVKLGRFIDEKTDADEREIARRQLRDMLAYSESSLCRRASLLHYFGESWDKGPCNGCDNCLEPRDTYDATLSAQKILSCVYRIRKQSGFDLGLHHAVNVLIGDNNEKVARLKHDELTTFGIGDELKKTQWIQLGQELIRKGFLAQSETEFRTIGLTEKGLTALIARASIHLTRPLETLKLKRRRVVEGDYDSGLFERLRALRKKLADERNVPAYIVFSDASLRQMASDRPRTLEAFGRISGVGQRKLKEFGSQFVRLINEGSGGVS